ncbi:MAG: TetR/AcrR family transcriptional regulator [Planctomycetota bacterium]
MSTTNPSRRERRKAQTRAALVGAAQELLADDRGAEVSIQEITDRADVGFGSFYNHFDSKEALFDAAVFQALDEHSAWLDEILQGEDDAALVFATSLRLTGRLLRTAPTMAHVVKNSLGPVLSAERGIAARARRDLTRCGKAAWGGWRVDWFALRERGVRA